MDIISVIKERRSCRNFLEKSIEQEKLEKILQAGLYAPSPMNKQPWEFLVVSNEQIKEQFKKSAQATLVDVYEKSGWKWLNSYKVDFLTQSPVYIVVVGDTEQNGAEQFLQEPGQGYQEACCAAVQNILLAAQAEGLGSLWYSLYDKKAARKIFSIEEQKDPVAVICLGYPAAPLGQIKRKSIEEKVGYLD